MSVEIKKIDNGLTCYTLICDDSGKPMVKVWSRTLGEQNPSQTIEARWMEGSLKGSGKFLVEGLLSCTPIEEGRSKTEIADFITDEIGGEVKLTAFIKQK